MSLKAIRVLSTIAFCLFAAALLVCVLSIPLYRPLLSIYGIREEDAQMTIPLPSLISIIASCGIALALMIMTRKLRTDQASKIAVIVLAVIIIVKPIINLLISYVSRWYVIRVFGYKTLASYFALSNVLSLILTPLTSPASLLMLLAMGAFCNRAGRLNGAANTAAADDCIGAVDDNGDAVNDNGGEADETL